MKEGKIGNKRAKTDDSHLLQWFVAPVPACVGRLRTPYLL